MSKIEGILPPSEDEVFTKRFLILERRIKRAMF